LKNKQIKVSTTVAASAAYPLLLPSLDRVFDFHSKSDGKEKKARVALTDGGVQENLAVSRFAPGRSPTHTSFVFNVDYIICCDAGHGISDASTGAYFAPSRLAKSFETVFKKATDYGRKLLYY
jgi:NTE family protein